jgi:chorismate dehydratase
MKRLRISAISYLNTAPLMWDFERSSAGEPFDISYTVPSQCAAQLASGIADVGIIPSAAYTAIPDLVVLPGMAIASKRAVRSILLVSKIPLEKVKTVGLDTSSLTSVALTKVLFNKWWGGGRQFVSRGPDLEAMLKDCDAGLLIGDPALQVDRSRYVIYDLAEEWIRLTGKPFVFAFWAIRRKAADYAPSDLSEIFQHSRDNGLKPESLDQISAEWAPRIGLTGAEVRSYLTKNINYTLDQDCLDGLYLFYKCAVECNALSSAPELEFLSVKTRAVI